MDKKDNCICKNNYLINIEVKTTKNKLDEIINSYSFYHISNEEIDFIFTQDIIQNLKQSKVLIVNIFIRDTQNIGFFIIGFKKTIIIIKQHSLYLLKNFFLLNSKMQIHFLSDSKDAFNAQIEISNNQIISDSILENEIKDFNDQIIKFRQKNGCFIHPMRSFILSCITGYLICESYLKLIKNQDNFQYRVQNYLKNLIILDDKDYVELRNIGSGSLFVALLIYHIENGELFVIKKPNGCDSEITKLIDREYNNYININYPFLPKFYGIIKDKKYPVIQFIYGKTLTNFDKNSLCFNDKITIILELMMTINYFHQNGFVYRDLKPDNIMITKNKNIFIIDFDRMIKKPEINIINDVNTADFSSIFADPKIISGKISFENDIYSLGQVINYIMNFTNQANEKNDLDESKSKLYEIYKLCISSNGRPCITDLMFEFYLSFYLKFNKSFIYAFPEIKYFYCLLKFNKRSIEMNVDLALHYYSFASSHNVSEAQFYLGYIYFEGKYVKQDINKAIYYFSLAAEKNSAEAQVNLGVIYHVGEHIMQNIDKAIRYYSLAADQNNPLAQYNLGKIYYFGEFIKQDLNKAIHLLSLAANNNFPDAQYDLGTIYYDGELIPRDINKAIHYLSLAADNKVHEAQNNLGVIFYEGKYTKQNINKAIYYYTLSANQSNSNAQKNLGMIYYEGLYTTRDIKKAIYYLSLSANQNEPDAQYYLGMIYYEGKYVSQDINKAIFYFSQAANQNHIGSQFILSRIYCEGKYIKRNINKMIYYLTLAADQNDPYSQYNLGLLYYEGIYTTRDINKSIHYCLLAANQNDPKAQFLLGLLYYGGKYIPKDINKAIKYFSLSSNQNYIDAQFNLAFIYHKDRDSTQDMNKAIYYYTLAANQNHLAAQNNLGMIYYKGKNIKRNVDKAIYYLTLAANQNCAQSLVNLGIIYLEGKYITHDINKSIHYFTLASKLNDQRAHCLLGLIYYNDGNVSLDIEKAIYYFTLASNQNDAYAHFYLGMIYYECKYIEIDIKKAIHYFTLAAAQNHPSSFYYLGNIYLNGKYVKRDFNKTIHYYLLAAKLNHPKAQLILGYIYAQGLLVKKDVIKGIDFFIQSSLNGCKSAHFQVGYFFHEGKYLKKDIKKSIYHYKEASSFNDIHAKNNLGIIYKNENSKEIPQNIGLAIAYFDESIHRFDDKVSMYNLAHIYIYENKTKERINDSIELLIKSSNMSFLPAVDLLCIALVIKNGYNIDHIHQDIKNKTNISSCLSTLIIKMIKYLHLDNESDFEIKYQYYKTIDYMYDFGYKIIHSGKTNEQTSVSINDKTVNNITSDFYKGFEDEA